MNTNNTCTKPTQRPVFYYAVTIAFLVLGQMLGLIPIGLMPNGPFKGLAFAIINALAIILPLSFLIQKRGQFTLKVTFRTSHKAPILAYLFVLLGTAGIILAGDSITSVVHMLMPKNVQALMETLYEKMNSMYMQMLYSEDLSLLPVSIFSIALMPAFYEEFAFRGFLQRNTEYLMKPMYAILGSSVLFTLVHANPMGSLQIFGLAMLFGYAAHKTDCIWVGFIAHALNNTFSVLVMHFSEDTGLSAMSEQSVWILIVKIIGGFTLIFLAFNYLRKLNSPIPPYIPSTKYKSDMFQNYQ